MSKLLYIRFRYFFTLAFLSILIWQLNLSRYEDKIDNSQVTCDRCYIELINERIRLFSSLAASIHHCGLPERLLKNSKECLCVSSMTNSLPAGVHFEAQFRSTEKVPNLIFMYSPNEIIWWLTPISSLEFQIKMHFPQVWK